MKILKLDLGIDHIGLYLKLIGDYAIIPYHLDEKYEKRLRDLGFKVIRIESEIIGPYILETDKEFILSKNSPENLIQTLKELTNITLINSKKNLLGNLFAINKNRVIYSKNYDKIALEELKQLGFEDKKIEIKEFPAIGGLIKIYRNRCLIAQHLSDKQIEKIVNALNPEKYSIGSVNFGSPFVKYGIELNDNVIFVGEKTTGHELLRIEEAFIEL